MPGSAASAAASVPASAHAQIAAPSKPDVADGALGQTAPTQGQATELDFSIGFSGKIVDSVHLHPDLKEYVLVAGSSIVVRDLQDPHN